MIRYFILYLILINAAAFILYGIDKKRAREGRWRIPEKILFGMAVIGGGAGALAGMSFFHHKTRKPRFYIGVPLLLLLEGAALVWLLK